MKQETQNWNAIYGILLIFLLVIMALPYFGYLELLPKTIFESHFYKNFCAGWGKWVFKLFYIIMLPLMTYMLFSVKIAKTTKPEEQNFYRYYYIFLSIFVLIGLINVPWANYYNMIGMPLLIIVHLFVCSRAFSKINTHLEDEEKLGLSKEPLQDLGLIYEVKNKHGEKDVLHVHNVFQSILVMGGAGAGKSASLIEPALYQWVKQGASLTVYDFKGNPATLGLLTYSAWLHFKKDWNEKTQGKFPKFELISFVELEKTSRPNPLSPLTMTSSLDTQSITKTLLQSLNPDFVKKQDFWAQSAFALAHGIAERLRKGYPKYCTIPHLISIGLQPAELLIEWLEQDFEVRAIIASFISAKKAESQLSGMLSSFQTPLTPLMNREIYWVLGAEFDKQTDLDLNNKENPRICCIANDPKKKAAFSPVISCILTNIMTNINQRDRHPHALVIDEYPTIYLDIAELPATGRSNKVCTMIAIQDKAQMEQAYGREISEKTIANLGTQFYGMSNSVKTAKDVEDMIGTAKKMDDSYSYSEDGVNFSKRLSNEKIIQASDVMDQPVGHFTGKIADGKPSKFSTQTLYWDPKKHLKLKKEIDILNYPEDLMKLHKVLPQETKKAFDMLVELNYLRINDEVMGILSGEIKGEEQEEERGIVE